MSDDADILSRLGALDDARLRVVSEQLSASELQQIVLAAASRGGEALETARRMLDARGPATEPAETDLRERDPAETESSTLISWEQLGALVGNDAILHLCDRLFAALEPWQRDLRDSVVDAFGFDLVGAEQLIESYLPVEGVDFRAVHESMLADGDIKIEYDPQGLGFVWFTRGPHVRRRPYIFLITGGRLAIGGDLAEDIPHTVAPYVAHFDGPDADVTPASWMEWFADAGVGRDNSSFQGANISASYFESADGPGDVVGIARQRLRDIVDSGFSDGSAASSPNRPPTGTWKGLSLEFSQGDDGAARTAGWLGSLFYR